MGWKSDISFAGYGLAVGFIDGYLHSKNGEHHGFTESSLSYAPAIIGGIVGWTEGIKRGSVAKDIVENVPPRVRNSVGALESTVLKEETARSLNNRVSGAVVKGGLALGGTVAGYYTGRVTGIFF